MSGILKHYFPDIFENMKGDHDNVCRAGFGSDRAYMGTTVVRDYRANSHVDQNDLR